MTSRRKNLDGMAVRGRLARPRVHSGQVVHGRRASEGRKAQRRRQTAQTLGEVSGVRVRGVGVGTVRTASRNPGFVTNSFLFYKLKRTGPHCKFANGKPWPSGQSRSLIAGCKQHFLR